MSKIAMPRIDRKLLSRKDIIIKGNDGGSTVTAATFDMSDAGQLILPGGINFPDTQAGSSDANTLDDYEEGIDTVTLQWCIRALPSALSTARPQLAKRHLACNTIMEVFFSIFLYFFEISMIFRVFFSIVFEKMVIMC